jgi:hypothetical protein
MRLWLYLKEHRHRDMRSQSPASRRLMQIRAASETTNRIAAHVNVGADAGRESGTATSD